MVDAAGLQFAWLAFEEVLEKLEASLDERKQRVWRYGKLRKKPELPKPSPLRDLPGLECYTPQQLFFISYAHVSLDWTSGLCLSSVIMAMGGLLDSTHFIIDITHLECMCIPDTGTVEDPRGAPSP